MLPFKDAKESFFDSDNIQTWNQLYNNFKKHQNELENKTMKLIDDTFKDLRSSEGAFDLLNNFKSIETLD